MPRGHHSRACDEPPRIAFAGTPMFAVRSLQALLDANYRISVVYTQPDRKAGRGRKLTPSPVKELAQEHALPIEQPQSMKTAGVVEQLREYAPDVLVVVAYGLILPREILNAPRFGGINVHASLLPRWRGAAPVQRAILAGDTETGISIMALTEGLDCGPVLLRESCPIGPRQTAGELHEHLSVLGAECLLRALDGLFAGTLSGTPQDDSLATYAAKIAPGEAEIDWSLPAITIDRMVRAFNPVPGARAAIAGQDLKIWSAQALKQSAGASPGSVLGASPEGIDVCTGEGVLRVTRVQEAGRKAVSAADFLNAKSRMRMLRK